MAETPAYKRILLKLSGEALMGEDSYGINRPTIERIVSEIAEVAGLGVEGTKHSIVRADVDHSVRHRWRGVDLVACGCRPVDAAGGSVERIDDLRTEAADVDDSVYDER